MSFAKRLGPHHFAHLRATAEGLSVLDCARRYLGTEHAKECASTHLQVVDRVRSIARRTNERAWRLVGVTIKAAKGAERPSLETFIEERGLDGWSESEQLEMYEAAYSTDPKAARRDRLRVRQVEMLHRLEQSAAERPQLSDLVSGWYDDKTASRLHGAGIDTLGDLATRIAIGGRWYSTMPGIGAGKAQRIASQLATLIPPAQAPLKKMFRLETSTALAIQATPRPAPVNRTKGHKTEPVSLLRLAAAGLQLATGERAPAVPGSLLSARSDVEAAVAWVRARASSPATARAYEKEAGRLMLWLQRERGRIAFRDLTAEDCLAYQAFLQHIPQGWISRAGARPGQPGWAPFRGPLGQASQLQAIKIVTALFAWLNASRYLAGNPWMLINTDTGTADVDAVLDTKALSAVALAEVLRYLEDQPPSPALHRARFVIRFVSLVGLRSAELLAATLGDFSLQPEGWVMRVLGKGNKARTVMITRSAMDEVQRYLDRRDLGSIETAPIDAPLLASARDPMEGITYQALYETVKMWLQRAISASDLPARERLDLAGATTHWLRHSFATESVAREVPYDVLQAQMGHSDLKTTMSTYSRAPLARRASEMQKAFD